MNMQLILVFIFVGGFATRVENANILFFFGVSSYSERISIWPLIKRLSYNGHNMTFLSGYPSKEQPVKNVVDFYPENLYSNFGFGDFLTKRLEKGMAEIEKAWFELPDMGIAFCEKMLKDEEILKWANASKYDLVILNSVFNDCGLSLVHKFKAKHILYSATSPFSWWSEGYGYLAESATYPEHTLHLPQKMSFFQRMQNTIRVLYWHWININYYYPTLENIIRESALNISDIPPLSDMHRNTHLVFVNSHYSEEYPRMLPPMIVPVAGMHCSEDRKPLPKDILDFIEGAGSNDVVYISFGSLINYQKMPQKLRHIFIDTFKKLAPTRFLWKFDGQRPDEFPNNVFTKDWMPQQDILANSKIKAFVSHGGLIGTEEAVFHAVPMIVFPIFAEQDYNAHRIHTKRTGIHLEIATVTQPEFETAIRNILKDNTYKQNMQAISKLFKDRPLSPVDTAVWWTEYVLRHTDTEHLRPLSAQQSWYERRLVDVWLFLFSTTLVILFVLGWCLSKIFGAFISNSKKEKIA